ncbi:hypothetical protein G6689_01715 [Polynucleobacter paneuropaeus]|nr:hypothetical protein G6689_01715 [Polynucleobacter paneuropaeus]
MAAFAQLYAVYVFTKTQTHENAALVFLLLGYSIWFQILEFGLSQTLQNKFNSREISSSRLIYIVLAHYVFMVVVAVFVSSTSYLVEILLPNGIIENNEIGVRSFTIGAALLVVVSSNTIIQRFLLVINRGSLGNFLIICQSCIVLLGLFIYENINEPQLIMGVLIYLAPQVLVYMPLMANLVIKLVNRRSRKSSSDFRVVLFEAIGFSGVGFLSILFLGSDYYFAAHYLSPNEIVSYYLVSRIFFISYVIYYGYVLHGSRRISTQLYQFRSCGIMKIFRNSCSVGALSVGCIYLLAALLNKVGAFDFITHGVEVSQLLLFIGFLYFMVRVVRDVALVIIGAVNKKYLLYQAYLIEVIFGLSAMYLLVPKFKEMGIFYALLTACLLSSIFLIYKSKMYNQNIVTTKCN